LDSCERNFKHEGFESGCDCEWGEGEEETFGREEFEEFEKVEFEFERTRTLRKLQKTIFKRFKLSRVSASILSIQDFNILKTFTAVFSNEIKSLS
jgi:hypothetical protein